MYHNITKASRMQAKSGQWHFSIHTTPPDGASRLYTLQQEWRGGQLITLLHTANCLGELPAILWMSKINNYCSQEQ